MTFYKTEREEKNKNRRKQEMVKRKGPTDFFFSHVTQREEFSGAFRAWFYVHVPVCLHINGTS